MGGVPILLKLIWQSLSTSRLSEKIFCNHMWKLNAGLEGSLLLRMEIALPHVISHAKALLSTFTSFASFTIKRIHAGTVLLGRWINFHSLTGTESVRACEISHVNTMNTGNVQYFTMSFMYFLPLALLLLSYLTVFITLYNRSANWSQLRNIPETEWRRQRGGNWWKIKWVYYLTQNSLPF